VQVSSVASDVVTRRTAGAFLGLAVGDAIGASVEFMAPGTFETVTDMIGGGPHNLEPGQWTDDTSMALCLAESLVERRGFDPLDQMQRYVRWYREGHLSSTGVCFDIGNATRAALHRFERTGDPFAGSTDPGTAGNGSIMRLAPVPLFFHRDARSAIHYAADSSRITHAARDAVDACRYMAGLMACALNGVSKDELLAPGSRADTRPLGGTAARAGGRRSRERLVPAQGAARDPRQRLRRRIARGRALGIQPLVQLRRRTPACRQPRRRRRYDRRGVRPDRRRILRRRRHSAGVARTASRCGTRSRTSRRASPADGRPPDRRASALDYCMDNESKDDRAREAAAPTGQVERAPRPPLATPPAEDTTEAHTYSDVVELGPLRAEIEVRSETLESRIARLQAHHPTGD
jgi:hypothetical protein